MGRRDVRHLVPFVGLGARTFLNSAKNHVVKAGVNVIIPSISILGYGDIGMKLPDLYYCDWVSL